MQTELDKVVSAVHEFYARETFLLDKDVGERALTHRLAVQLPPPRLMPRSLQTRASRLWLKTPRWAWPTTCPLGACTRMPTWW